MDAVCYAQKKIESYLFSEKNYTTWYADIFFCKVHGDTAFLFQDPVHTPQPYGLLFSECFLIIILLVNCHQTNVLSRFVEVRTPMKFSSSF